MYNNDYVILVDENGQPYIAHGVVGNKARAAWGSVKNTATKYLKKIQTATGKWRYIYDPKELAAVGKRAAKKAWGSKVGRFIDEHDAGLSERLQAKYYSNKSKRASRKGLNDDATAYALKGAAYRKEAKAEGERAKRTLAGAGKRAWGSKAGRFIDEHDAGLTEALQAKYYSNKSKRASRKGLNDDATDYALKGAAYRKESKEQRNAALAKFPKVDVRNAARALGKSVDDLGIDEFYRYMRANKNKNMSGQQKQQYQREWQESTLGRKVSRRKN